MSAVLLVVPDTNTLYSDPFLEGPQIKTILAAEDHTGTRLGIPKAVVDELRNQVTERIERAAKDASDLRRRYAQLSGLSPYALGMRISADDAQRVLDRFHQRFKGLASEGRILDYPTVSPRELARRSIRVQPPFKSEDRGMRDTLIWLTIKEYVTNTSDPQVALVTRDAAFLSKDKAKLNESLTEELRVAGTPPDSITVWPSLQEFISTLIAGRLPDANWVRVAIEGGRIEDFTASSDTVLLEATDWIMRNPHILEVGGYEDVQFDVVEGVSLDSIERTLELFGNEVLVDSEWRCDVVAEGFENRYLSESVRVELRFRLNSVVDVSHGEGTVTSHEVTDMDVVDFYRHGPSPAD